MLQEYHAQLEQQLAQGEPWTDVHAWAILTGEVDVLIRETLQLYTDLIWTDESHHYCATTQPQYLYTQMEAQIETLFHEVRDILVKESVLAARLDHHGYPPKGPADVAQCLRALDVLLADENPIYTSEPFQAVLQQSLDDIKAGRVVELTPEWL